MTELGVYILGAAALIILTMAGVVAGSSNVVLCAVVASGAAYVSQFGAASAVMAHDAPLKPQLSFAINIAGMAVAFAAWAYGVWLLF